MKNTNKLTGVMVGIGMVFAGLSVGAPPTTTVTTTVTEVVVEARVQSAMLEQILTAKSADAAKQAVAAQLETAVSAAAAQQFLAGQVAIASVAVDGVGRLYDSIHTEGSIGTKELNELLTKYPNTPALAAAQTVMGQGNKLTVASLEVSFRKSDLQGRAPQREERQSAVSDETATSLALSFKPITDQGKAQIGPLLEDEAVLKVPDAERKRVRLGWVAKALQGAGCSPDTESAEGSCLDMRRSFELSLAKPTVLGTTVDTLGTDAASRFRQRIIEDGLGYHDLVAVRKGDQSLMNDSKPVPEPLVECYAGNEGVQQ